MSGTGRWLYGFIICISLGATAALVWRNFSRPDESENALRILAYSSFTASWGPGPELVTMFEAEMRKAGKPEAKVILMQAEDAGLLIAKMRSFPADVVIGFDQLGRHLAEKSQAWRPHGISKARFSDAKFLAFDWAPLGFIYRKGETDPPKNFDDLLDARFENAIALQDPRSSSPGFQFLSWLVTEMGEEAAFAYLRKLKPNVQSTSGSWSQSYGIFTRGLAKLAFGYETSILYHRLSEKDDRYEFIRFPGQHPTQFEFAAIPESCGQCEMAQEFLEFLVRPEAQAVIMKKNWMLPVNSAAAKGTPFEPLMNSAPTLITRKKIDGRDPEDELLKRWREAVL